MVMLLISFLYVMTTKVIQHNLEKKIPTYVYYLYQNLENKNNVLTRKLKKEEENKNKSIEDILSSMSAKDYCDAFAEDTNLVGNVDCENSIKEVEIMHSTNKTINYNCTRSYSFNILDDGTVQEIKEPILESLINTCESNDDLSNENIKCKAKPTIPIDNLFVNNTQALYAYNCKMSKSEDNETENNQFFDINAKPNFNNSLKTINNINLNFINLIQANEYYILKYDLFANIDQDAICPQISRAKFNTSSLSCTITFDKINLIGDLYGKTSTISYTKKPYEFSCRRQSGFLKPANYTAEVKIGAEYGMHQTIPTMNNNCTGYINHARDMIKFKQIDFINYKDKKIWYPGVDGPYCNDSTDKTVLKYCAIDPPEDNTVCFLYINIILNKSTILDSDSQNFNHELYYNKWTNFFNNNPNFSKVTKGEVNLTNKNEGSIEKTIEKKAFQARFIYATIDTLFEKGEMNKNIFVFEQFKDRIIPVGYLANNEKSPLKFDVITRNPQTLKINKLNDKPLTYCGAMQYTGDKFSQHCGCKYENTLVTQYEKHNDCKNAFGCKIRPVKPIGK